MNGATFAFAALAVVTVLWLWMAAALRVVYRARRPREGPTTSELRDDPPAIVNMLTHDWVVTGSAPAATLLDLARRGVIEIVQISPEQDVIQLRRPPREVRDLLPYERQVFDHLRRTAVGGVVPATALTTGPATASDAWWARFRRSVEKDARRRGLSQRRFPPAVIAGLGVSLAVLVLWLFVAFSTTKDAAPDNGPKLWSVLAAAAARGDERAGGGSLRPQSPARHRRRSRRRQPLARCASRLRRRRELRRTASRRRRAVRTPPGLRQRHGRGRAGHRPAPVERGGRSPRLEPSRRTLAAGRGALPDATRRLGAGPRPGDGVGSAVDGDAAHPDLRPRAVRLHDPRRPRGLRPLGRAGVGSGQQPLRRADRRPHRARRHRPHRPRPARHRRQRRRPRHDAAGARPARRRSRAVREGHRRAPAHVAPPARHGAGRGPLGRRRRRYDGPTAGLRHCDRRWRSPCIRTTRSSWG